MEAAHGRDERTGALLEEDLLERLEKPHSGGDDNETDDEGSSASYVMSRRSSYTDSLPPGLGNRVCLRLMNTH